MAAGSIERQLGILIGKLEGIEDRLERADESRAGLHKSQNEIVIRITHLESDVLAVKNKADKIENVTDDVTKMRQQAQGAGTAGQWLLKAGVGILGFAGWAFGIYTWLTGRPPP